jgi:hypothetical protein
VALVNKMITGKLEAADFRSNDQLQERSGRNSRPSRRRVSGGGAVERLIL